MRTCQRGHTYEPSGTGCPHCRRVREVARANDPRAKGLSKAASQRSKQKHRTEINRRQAARRAARRVEFNARARERYARRRDHFQRKSKLWRIANADKWRARQRANKRAETVAHPERALFQNARKRTQILGVPFDLRRSDVVVPSICPVLGIPLVVAERASADGSPTIDRIVPSRGYVSGNIIVVSNRANRIKNDASMAELRSVADFYERLLSEVCLGATA